MKKISSFLLIVFLLAIFVATPVSAATNAGIKPSSFLYFFDTTFEKVNLFFTFNPEKKVKKALKYADERLAEAETLTDGKDSNMVKTVMENYTANIVLASEKSKEVKDQQVSENLFSTIADSTSKNQEVLNNVLAKVPEEAKDAILKAIEASKKEQEEATKQIAELKGEVEKLKQEVAELKQEKELLIPKDFKSTNKEIVNDQTEQISVIKKEEQEENWKEYIVLMYAGKAEDIKRFIESISDDISYIKDSQNRLQGRIDVAKNLYFSNPIDDTLIFNKMIDVYIEEHEKEIKRLNDNLTNINININFLDVYRTEYNKTIYSLLADSKKVITREESIELQKYYTHISLEKIYEAEQNIFDLLDKVYNSITDFENQNKEVVAILKDTLSKIKGTNTISMSDYYQPLPLYNINSTSQKELLSKPIKCMITHGQYESFVDCY